MQGSNNSVIGQEQQQVALRKCKQEKLRPAKEVVHRQR